MGKHVPTNFRFSGKKLVRRTRILLVMAMLWGSSAGVQAQEASFPPVWKPLNTEVNSPYQEFNPIVSADGKTLYFSRKNHPQNIGEEDNEDIWISKKQASGIWSRPVNAGFPLNNQENNAVIAVSPASDTLFLAGTYRSGPNDGIFFSKREGRTWSRPQYMPIDGFAPLGETISFSIGVNGRYLLIATQLENTLGGGDLYVCFRKPGNFWSAPLNLGPLMNTPYHETDVFLAADGKTLYFSSDRPGGFGGLDLYMSRRLDDSWTRWSEPQNLGSSINTPNDDHHYAVPASGAQAFGFYPTGNGQLDLFQIELPPALRPEPVLLVKGQLLDGKTQKRMPGKLGIESLEEEASSVQYKTNKNGQFQVVLPYDSEVGFYAVSDGYISVSSAVGFDSTALEEEDGRPLPWPPSDPETEALQQKLTQLDEELNLLSTSEAYRNSPAAAEPEKSRKKEKSPAPAEPSDPALEQIRSKYQPYLEPEKRPEGDVLTARGGTETQSELDRMKDQYNRLHQPQEAPPSAQADPGQDTDLQAMKERYNRLHTEPTDGSPPAQAKGSISFEKVQNEVRAGLVKQLAPTVQQELRKDLFPHVSAELVSDLPKDEQALFPQAQRKLMPQYLGASATSASLPEQIDWQADDLPDWLVQLRQELMESMRDEIEQELREKLTPTIKEELRRQLLYQVKMDLENELREELAAKATPSTEPSFAPDPPAPAYKEITCDILLIPIRVGEVIPLNNVFFEANEATLKEVSYRELDRMLEFLHNQKDLVVEVGGHTNGWCSHSFANELSEARAKVVADYFMQNGVPSTRLSFKGYGKTKPLDTNDTAEGRKKNQRVEIKIMRILEF